MKDQLYLISHPIYISISRKNDLVFLWFPKKMERGGLASNILHFQWNMSAGAMCAQASALALP